MNKTNLKDYNIILFLSFANVFYANFYSFNYLIDEFHQSAWLAFVIIFVMNFLIILTFKGFTRKFSPLKVIKNNYPMRIVTLVYCILSALVMIIYSSVLMKNFFYYETPIYIFFILTTITAVFLSYYDFSSIISTSTIFFTFFIIFYIFPFLYLKQHDFHLLMPFSFDFKKVYKIIPMLLFFLDNYIVIFYSPKFRDGIKKKHLLLGNSFAIFYSLYILIDSITILGSKYFENTQMTAFTRWQVFKGYGFIENYDIFLLIIVTVSTIYKLSVYFNLTRLIIFEKRKRRFGVIFGALFLILTSLLYLFMPYWEKYLIYILITLFVLILTICIYFTKKSWEIYYENNGNIKQYN